MQQKTEKVEKGNRFSRLPWLADTNIIEIRSSKVNFPVSRICSELFNGGGHLQASGGEFHGTLEECRELLIKNLDRYDRYLPKRFEKLDVRQQ